MSPALLLLLAQAALSQTPSPALAPEPPTPTEDAVALIYGGGVRPQDADAALVRWKEDLAVLGDALLPSPGFPKIVRSDDVRGLKPGFFIVLLGVCDADEGALVAGVLQSLDAGAYTRPAPGSALACPKRRAGTRRAKAWVVEDKGRARLMLTELNEEDTVSQLFAVARGADGKLLFHQWVEGRGVMQGPIQATCELDVSQERSRLVLVQTCTGIFSMMCTWPDKTKTTTLALGSGAVTATARTSPKNPKPIACGE